MPRAAPMLAAAVALLAGAALAAPAALAPAARQEPRAAFVSDVDGNYSTALALDGACPDAVSIAGTSGTDGAVGRTPVVNIVEDGATCAGGTMFSVPESIARKEKALAEAGLDFAFARLKANAPAFAAVNQPRTTETLVAFDDAARTCGGNNYPTDTFYLFIKEGTGQDINIQAAGGNKSVTIPPGKKGLFIITNDRRLCVLTASATPSTTATTAVPVVTDPDTGLPVATTTKRVATDPDTGRPVVDGKKDAKKDSGSACFPASATVLLADGRSIPMSALAVGDAVHVGAGVFSPVFMFTHKVAAGAHAFTTLTTASGAALTATPGHYVYANGALVAAGAVAPGDLLTLASGVTSPVTAVSTGPAAGLYNPQTLHGDIAVDGVVASTYTSAVAPALAHALLAPLRAVAGRFALTALESGGGVLDVLAPRGGLQV